MKSTSQKRRPAKTVRLYDPLIDFIDDYHARYLQDNPGVHVSWNETVVRLIHAGLQAMGGMPTPTLTPTGTPAKKGARS
jgi:hypothetical protein